MVSVKKEKINIKLISFIIFVTLIVLFLIFVLFKQFEKNNKIKTSQVDIDGFEISSGNMGYVMLDEKVIKYSNKDDDTVMPICDEFKRVSKNSVVAVYKSKDYESKINRLYEIDKEIDLKLSKLPYIYSKEVVRIDKDINEFINKSEVPKTYIEMLNFKNYLDELTYKKAIIKSKISPSGKVIENLLNERNRYLTEIQEDEKNTIKTDRAGIVSYKIDGSEISLDNKDLNKLNFNEIDKFIDNINNVENSSFGIKIVDNYNAYIIFKFNNSINDEYAILNRYYTLNIVNLNKNIKGLLISKLKKDDFNYYLFKVNNNIEDLLSNRKIDFKIIWKSLNGFAIPKECLKYKNINDAGDKLPYVEVLSMNDKIDIFVKKVIDFEDYFVVQNYTTNEREKYGIQEKRKLLRYDRLVRF